MALNCRGGADQVNIADINSNSIAIDQVIGTLPLCANKHIAQNLVIDGNTTVNGDFAIINGNSSVYTHTSGTAGTSEVSVISNNQRIILAVNDAGVGTRGIWDSTNSKWMIYKNLGTDTVCLPNLKVDTTANITNRLTSKLINGLTVISKGLGTSYVDTGIPMNAGFGGGVFLVLYRNNTGDGNNTTGEVGILRCRYSGSAVPQYTFLGGSVNGSALTGSKLTWSINSSNVIVKSDNGGNSVIHLIGSYGSNY